MFFRTTPLFAGDFKWVSLPKHAQIRKLLRTARFSKLSRFLCLLPLPPSRGSQSMREDDSLYFSTSHSQQVLDNTQHPQPFPRAAREAQTKGEGGGNSTRTNPFLEKDSSFSFFSDANSSLLFLNQGLTNMDIIYIRSCLFNLGLNLTLIPSRF